MGPASLIAVRDSIALSLYLCRSFPELRTAWHDIDDASWEFIAQPAYMAAQIRETFANKSFVGLPALLRIDREASGDQFAFSGTFTATGPVYSYFWRQTGLVLDPP